MREIVFDLETTGFRYDEGHRIVEIGAIEMVRGAVTGKSFHTYVNPERDMPDGAYQVHGLSAEFLSDKPKFDDASVADAFLDFIGESRLVAHNGEKFDLPFLNAQLAGFDRPTIPGERLTDTLPLARRRFPGAPASLDALCSRFGIDTAERERDGHGALLDSRLLATVYIELTGGAQAGLSFSEDDEYGATRRPRKPVKQRPTPLPSLISKEEAAAHEAFIESLGPDSIWAKKRLADA
ncbi:MAG: DNA polymerase III subunit epsilon [Pseudomonadota bacterium]